MGGLGSWRKNMSHFEYVTKKETAAVREEIEEIIREVQDEVREHFTFSYQIISSTKRNMITRDAGSNTGFDFDYNIEPNVKGDAYSPKQIKEILRKAFEKIGREHGYTRCEDSTRVITIKQYDNSILLFGTRIFHSCDFAILRRIGKKKEYIHYDKARGIYLWETQPEEYRLDEKVEYLKENRLWQEVRDEYLELKNSNRDREKKSRMLYAEAVNNIYDQYK